MERNLVDAWKAAGATHGHARIGYSVGEDVFLVGVGNTGHTYRIPSELASDRDSEAQLRQALDRAVK